MKLLIILTFVLLSACDFHFGMEDLNKGTCIQEVNSTYVDDGTSKRYTTYRVESKSDDTYSVSTWHNRAWLFLSKKPRDYFIDGKIFKYTTVVCPDTKVEKKGMKAKIKSLDLWKK